MARVGATALEWSSAVHIGGSLVALIGCFLIFYYLRGGADAEPLHLFEAYHIACLFSASNTAFLSSTLLLLWRMFHNPEKSALGISLHAQRLNLAAVFLRCIWIFQSHFSRSWLTCIEAALSVLSTVTLAVVIDPQLSAMISILPSERRPVCATPEAFPSAPLFVGCVFFAFCAAPLHADSLQWMFAAATIYVEAGAVLPQRSLLIKTKSLPALTSHAFFLLAIAGTHALTSCGRETSEWLTARVARHAGRSAAPSDVGRADARGGAAHRAYAGCRHPCMSARAYTPKRPHAHTPTRPHACIHARTSTDCHGPRRILCLH